MSTIAATTTRTGLRVRAGLDTGGYGTGVKISDAQMDALPPTRSTSPAPTWPGSATRS